MADNESTPPRKKLRLKSTSRDPAQSEEKASGAQSDSGEDTPKQAESTAPESEETTSIKDPLAARDAEGVDNLKRVHPENSPSEAKALTESDRLGPPGSETVRLKVVRDKRHSRDTQGSKSSETIRLRPTVNRASEEDEAPKTEEQEPASTTETAEVPQQKKAEKTPAAGTLKITPSAGTDDDQEVRHTATLRVPRRPEHKDKERQEAPAAETGEKAEAGETQPAEKKSLRGTETLKIHRRDEGPKEESAGAAEDEGQAKPSEGGEAPKKTPRVARQEPAQQPSPPAETEAPDQPVASEEEEETAGEETPTAAETSSTTGKTKTSTQTLETSTAPLKRISKDKAKAEAEGQGEKPKSPDTIRIKPPSKAKTFAAPEAESATGTAEPPEQAKEKAPEAAPSEAAAPKPKGTGKITLKTKSKAAQKTVSLKEAEGAQETVQVSEQPAATTQLEEAPVKKGKTMKLKGQAAGAEAAPSAETVEQAVQKTAAQHSAKPEPGVLITLAAAASLIGVGALVFFAVYQYLALFTTLL